MMGCGAGAGAYARAGALTPQHRIAPPDPTPFSFVAMRLYDPADDGERARLAALIGERAERLVHAFCTVDRASLEATVLAEGSVREQGYELADVRHPGSVVRVSKEDACAFLIETVADYLEQSTGWQSEMQQLGPPGAGGVLWPGPMRPTLRMAMVSRLARAAARAQVGTGECIPVFDNCTATLEEADEAKAVDLYWSVVAERVAQGEAAEAALEEASRLNPFVGEPHVVRAQLLLARGAWDEARDACARGLKLLEDWGGTCWDKRMPWAAWVNWCRAMALQADARAWPCTHGGVESLGATEAHMTFRELNQGRSMAPRTEREMVS